MILKGRGSLQDIDQFALMKPHTKLNLTIKSVKDIIPCIRKAFYVAQSGIPGPVFIEYPLDTLWPRDTIAMLIGVKEPPKLAFNKQSLQQNIQYLYLSRHLHNIFDGAFQPLQPLNYSNTVMPIQPNNNDVQTAYKHLVNAKRPLILIGSQAVRANTTSDLIKAIERLGVPVYLSGMGRGLLGKSHPLQMRHKRGNALAKTDYIMLLGTPQDFRLEYGKHINPRAYFIAVNLCSVTLKKNSDIRKPSLRCLADSTAFIVRLAELSSMHTGVTPTNNNNNRSEWFKFLNDLQVKREKEIDSMMIEETKRNAGRDFINPVKLCKEIDNIIADDSILIGDGGDFVGTASYILRPRGPLRWLDPGVFGTLGVGAGFAMASKACKSSSQVWIIFGDGSSGWSLSEFDTFTRMNLPVIAVIGNDACWSQMYRDQSKLLNDTTATTLAYTNYHEVAKGFGAHGIIINRDEQIQDALNEAVKVYNTGKSVLINCIIAKSGFREGSVSL
jgi:thiamine pyrophosphate-dependent acetolactate synthase large subunit-like protein